jgi:ABC-type sulfate transport system permease subunit
MLTMLTLLRIVLAMLMRKAVYKGSQQVFERLAKTVMITILTLTNLTNLINLINLLFSRDWQRLSFDPSSLYQPC